MVVLEILYVLTNGLHKFVLAEVVSRCELAGQGVHFQHFGGYYRSVTVAIVGYLLVDVALNCFQKVV